MLPVRSRLQAGNPPQRLRNAARIEDKDKDADCGDAQIEEVYLVVLHDPQNGVRQRPKPKKQGGQHDDDCG